MVIQIKQLPIPIPETGYVVEPAKGEGHAGILLTLHHQKKTGRVETPNVNFLGDAEITPIQMLYQDSMYPNSPQLLPPKTVRQLWELLKSGEPNPELFYRPELHNQYGAEVGDLKHVLNQLYFEMRFGGMIIVNGAFVVDNKSGLVQNLGDTRLPAFITPIGVSTVTPVDPKDKEHGMTLEEFKEAGGKIVAHGAFPADSYVKLKRGEPGEPTRLSQPIEPLGAKRYDGIYALLFPDYSDGVYILSWTFGEASPCLCASLSLEDSYNPIKGALRGRKLR